MSEETSCKCGNTDCKSDGGEGITVNGEWYCSIECAGDKSKKGGRDCCQESY